MKKITLSAIILVVIHLFTVQTKAQAPAQCTDVMLQGFYWDSYSDSKWTNLNSQTSELAGSFDLIWLPPSGNANSQYSNNMGYADIYWFNQNSSFGSQADLKTLISNLKNEGTRCVADIVVNHRSGVTSWTDFPTETYNGVTYSLGNWAICNTDECVAAGYPATGAADTGDDFNGSRDLDHTNTTVQNTIKAYLGFMKNDMGYAGWRYDMTKGYSGSFTAIYNDAAGADYSVGEYWDASFDNLYNWIKAAGYKSTAFDFAFKYALNNWASSGNLTNLVWLANGVNQPAGLIHQSYTKRYATTFIDNHDTYRDANKFTGDVLMANAFMLSSPGVPCVFLPHWMAYKSQIKAMIAARHAVQVNSESTVTVNQSASNLYVATVTGKTGTLIVKLGSGSYTAPTDYTLATSGTNYAIYIKGGTLLPTLTVALNSGTYSSGQTVSASATNNASIYYTTDGSTPTAASPKYSTAITLPVGTTTFKAIAIDGSGNASKVATYSYVIIDKQSSITVRFKAPATWTSVAVYVWEIVNGSATQLAGAWPGKVVTKDEAGYYTYTITNFTQTTVNVIFDNNNNQQQTADLSTTSNICWNYGTTSTSGSNTIYAVTVDPSCVTAVENPVADSWNVYPNPTHDRVRFTIPANADKITVTSALGMQTTVEAVVVQEEAEVSLSTLPSGIYYITVWSKDGTKQTRPIVKM